MGNPRRFIAYFIRVFGLASSVCLWASPGGQAFDSAAGVIDVDWAAYMSKHDVVFNKPVTNPVQGATVGNGKMGAMVWSANGLTMQFSGVDTSEQTAFSAGTVNLYTSPGMDTGYATFQQRLSLYDGTLVIKYDADRTVTIMGSPNSEVMGIHVDDSRAGVSAVTVDIGVWDVSTLTNSGDVPDLTTWKTVSTYTDADGAGISRGQTDANNFGYTLAGSVEGAAFTPSVVDGRTVRLTITPSASYTIWVSCATRLNAASHDSLAAAKAKLTNIKAAGYAATLAAFKAWWHAFWAKSFVQYSSTTNTDADYLENLYYLSMYMLASGGYGNYPCHFINGVFRATQDNTKWSNAYWYWNQRDLYNCMLSSNHADMMAVFNNLYSRNFAALKADTLSRYSIDGIWVPETMGFDGNPRGTIYSDYTKLIYSTGTEAAENMALQYAYTNDLAYFTATAYPFMREVCKFYSAKLSVNGGGKYYMASSNAHETYWNVTDAITDLAAVRSLFPITILAAQTLGLDAGLVTQWQNVLANLVPYPVDPNNAGQYYPCDPPLPAQSNGENVTCELAWPYGVVGLGTADLSFGVSNWNTRPNPYSNVWSPDAIQAARLGLGDKAYQGLKIMLGLYQNYPNGMTNNTNGVFEYLGVHLAAVNESLLQSYDGKIRVFPALPGDPGMVSKFTLAAVGGFLVTSERENSEIKYVGVKSLFGNPATVVNPWGGQNVQVRRASDNGIVLTTSAAEFNFSTASSVVYVVERVSKPLAFYSAEQLTGTQNQDAKMMDSNILGTFAGAPPDTGKYEAENANLTACVSNGDVAASGMHEVTNLSQGSAITFTNVRAGNQLSVQYCTQNSPGKLALYINGAKSQDILFVNTHSWGGAYAIVSVSAVIPAGATLTLQYDAGGSGANIDYIQVFTGAPATLTVTPTLTAVVSKTPVPAGGCNIQCEDYTAYWDTTAGNNGGQYRFDDVDIEGCGDAGGGYDIGFTADGEWLEFNISVPTTGNYNVTFRTASNNASGGVVKLTLDGSALGGNVNLPNTTGWQTYLNTVESGLPMAAGLHTLRMTLVTGGSNYNYLCINLAATPTPTPSPSASPSYSATPNPTLSATFSPTPSLVVSAAASATSTPTPLPSQTPTPSPSFSFTIVVPVFGTATRTPGTIKADSRVMKALPIPNPQRGPDYCFGLNLDGGSDVVHAGLYTANMTRLAAADFSKTWQEGWNALWWRIPELKSGLYFAKFTAGSGQNGKIVTLLVTP